MKKSNQFLLTTPTYRPQKSSTQNFLDRNLKTQIITVEVEKTGFFSQLDFFFTVDE